ncbi:tRNA lysidine(34) synthetase [Desulfovibrio inopinatus]|uniref:tRNA lysidine(34) synthetase n=1 Tax=Desulfovibrio inopinatus TaxID=102109 RepID=UPI0003FD87D9|nr:tRNA 2-thiocytidine biosynthesis TtcA family protein [Desulfovibrio inopinatus]
MIKKNRIPDLKRLNYAQKYCLGKTGKLMLDTRMLSPGSRIGLAVSGGVDSLVLLYVMWLRRRILPFFHELMVLHINPGFDPKAHEALLGLTGELGLSAHVEITDFGPRAHSDENKKNSACFYCGMLRRKRLFALCRQYNLTHLAFGHTATDLVSTFFMNLFQTGRVDGMSATEPFFHGRLQVIRPMLLVEKPMIIKAARAWELPVTENVCPSAHSSTRSDVENWLEDVFHQAPRKRTNVYNALRKWQLAKHLVPREKTPPDETTSS